MNQIRPTLIFISAALVVVGFCVSLLTNYASDKVPDFLQKNPRLIWILIVIGLITLIILTVGYYLIENRGSKTKFKSRKPHQEVPSPINISPLSMKYDAFISYSHKDADWVQSELLPRLENHGFKVCIDFRDFPGGGAAISSMENAVISSKRVILVMTPSYIESEWGTFENLMARTIDPAAIRRKVVPLLKETCEIPLYLKMLTYRDLRSDTSDEWDRLMQDLI
jgi:hypothetical protein